MKKNIVLSSPSPTLSLTWPSGLPLTTLATNLKCFTPLQKEIKPAIKNVSFPFICLQASQEFLLLDQYLC